MIQLRNIGTCCKNFFTTLEELQNEYFQHDVRTTDAAQINVNFLKELVRLISSLTDHIYPPRSPDLTPPDYFLFPILKNTTFTINGSNYMTEKIVEDK